ncbi:MAG: hypothetical protein ACM31O_01485 [Bacteroidota bacterium]
MTTDIVLTDDERDLILQMRAWKNGVPEEELPSKPERAVYVSLVEARAELYRLALRHGHNDVSARYERFHKLLSAGLLIELCDAWNKWHQHLRDEELRDETNNRLFDGSSLVYETETEMDDAP